MARAFDPSRGLQAPEANGTGRGSLDDYTLMVPCVCLSGPSRTSQLPVFSNLPSPARRIISQVQPSCSNTVH